MSANDKIGDMNMLPSIKSVWPELHKKMCAMQTDMIVAGGKIQEHGSTFAQLADWTEELVRVEAAARALTEECQGGRAPPSLGALANLESALSIAWSARTADGTNAE